MRRKKRERERAVSSIMHMARARGAHNRCHINGNDDVIIAYAYMQKSRRPRPEQYREIRSDSCPL